MNKQPFYHVATVLFTATRRIDREEFEKALKLVKFKGLVRYSMECEQLDAEAGDPTDLMS